MVMLLVLLALWILFNGKFTPEILLFGLVLSSAITWFCWRFMDYSFKAEKTALRLIPGALGYLWLLICEIVKSNLTLLGYVYSGREVKPKLVTFRTPLRSRLARNVLSNSITLTPGTITMDIAEEEGQTYYYVHWIDVTAPSGKEAGDAIKGALEKGVRRVFK